MTKVKVIMDYYNSKPYYEIRSKSLTAALQRATLLVEALGEARTEFEYATDEKKGKTRHIFFIYTS